MIRFQDRVLYGTDIELDDADQAVHREKLSKARETYLSDLIYFATDRETKVSDGEAVLRGLSLPPKVLEKLFYTNAQNWYQDI